MATIRRKLGHSRRVAIPRATCHLLAGQLLAEGEEAPVNDWSTPWRGRLPFEPLQTCRKAAFWACKLSHLPLLAQPSAAAGVAVRAATGE